MIIKTDADGKDAIEQLVDIALKKGGIQNLNAANLILSSLKPLPKPEPEPDEEKVEE